MVRNSGVPFGKRLSSSIDQTNQALVELKKQQEEFQKSEQIYYEMLLDKEQNTRKYLGDFSGHTHA
mgnify:CR=1 FL=1